MYMCVYVTTTVYVTEISRDFFFFSLSYKRIFPIELLFIRHGKIVRSSKIHVRTFWPNYYQNLDPTSWGFQADRVVENGRKYPQITGSSNFQSNEPLPTFLCPPQKIFWVRRRALDFVFIYLFIYVIFTRTRDCKFETEKKKNFGPTPQYTWKIYNNLLLPTRNIFLVLCWSNFVVGEPSFFFFFCLSALGPS